MALSDKKRVSNDRWIKENYKQVKLSMPKVEAETLEAYCSSRNISKAGFIRAAIKEKMEREGSATTTNNIESDSDAAECAHSESDASGKR